MNKARRPAAILIFAGLICWLIRCPALVTAGVPLTVTGYWKNFFLALRFSDPPRWSGAAITRLRLNANLKPNNWLNFALSEDVYAEIQDPTLAATHPGGLNPAAASAYRVTGWSSRLLPRGGNQPGNFSLLQNLDRCYVSLKSSFGDIIIGRQPVAWGSSRVISPTDIIVPFAFNELDKEERFGVDALRIRIPTGALGEVDGGWIAGKNFRYDLSAFFLRGKVNVLKTDLSLLALEFRRHLLLGCDISRSIAQAGGWLEFAYIVNNPWGSQEVSPEPNYVRCTVGMDTQVRSGWYGFVEYHFNSAGASRPADYASLNAKNAYRDGAIYLLGKHYGILGSTFQVTPLLSSIVMVLHNFSDGSWACAPQMEYNVREDVYIAAGMFLFAGRALSEFRLYPNFFFTSFRVYF